MSVIALPVLERDIRAALARVQQGESLLILDGDKQIAQLTPAPDVGTGRQEAGSLVDFFVNSPLRDSGLDLERDRSGGRIGVEF